MEHRDQKTGRSQFPQDLGERDTRLDSREDICKDAEVGMVLEVQAM